MTSGSATVYGFPENLYFDEMLYTKIKDPLPWEMNNYEPRPDKSFYAPKINCYIICLFIVMYRKLLNPKSGWFFKRRD